MRILKRILVALVVLAALFVGIGLLLPETTRVQRSVVIARPAADVYAMLDSYERFNAWSPWFERDPKAEYAYEGNARGVGASMRWKSANPDVGNGRQSIIESEPNARVVTRLEFEGQGDAIATFALQPAPQGTQVVWMFETQHGNDIIGRWFGLMFDQWIGPDYEKGLAKLKTLMESEAAP
jgi:uncharacterized protein YndB with AHSA1/START domain